MKRTSAATWEHLVIENGYGEQRFLCAGEWGGDTYFYFDVDGGAFVKYPTAAGEPETFEQISSGDRWSLCEGFHLNTISGESVPRGCR